MEIDEITNASRHPQIFYCRHMTPGLAGYAAGEGRSNYLVDTEAMKRMATTMNGKPIYVGHKKVDLQNIQEQADGYVADCFYNEVDGALWARCIAVSDKAHDAVKEKWDVSNAYIPTVTDKGGTYNGVDYSKKVLEANFTHLAIVPEGRYNEAAIFTPEEFKEYQATKKNELRELQNSKEKNNNGGFKMKLFKNKREEVTNSTDLDDDTIIEIANGVEVTLGDMKKAVLAETEKQNAKEKINMDSEIECGDEKMSIKELMNRYEKSKKNSKEKKNEDAEAGEESDDEAEAKKTAAEEKKNKKVKEKKNEDDDGEEKENELTPEEAKYLKKFREIQNAADKGKKHVVKNVDTTFDQLRRGKEMYGSGSK